MNYLCIFGTNKIKFLRRKLIHHHLPQYYDQIISHLYHHRNILGNFEESQKPKREKEIRTLSDQDF